MLSVILCHWPVTCPCFQVQSYVVSSPDTESKHTLHRLSLRNDVWDLTVSSKAFSSAGGCFKEEESLDRKRTADQNELWDPVWLEGRVGLTMSVFSSLTKFKNLEIFESFPSIFLWAVQKWCRGQARKWKHEKKSRHTLLHQLCLRLCHSWISGACSVSRVDNGFNKQELGGQDLIYVGLSLILTVPKGSNVYTNTKYIQSPHLRAIMKFVASHRGEPVAFWRKVLWSAETKTELFGNNNQFTLAGVKVRLSNLRRWR